MKITKIRYWNNKLPEGELKLLAETLADRIASANFIVDVEVINGTTIKLSKNSSSFKIDTAKLGHNARYSPFKVTKKGYTRTNTPTWDQRVQFNNIVNHVLSEWEISANVKSGAFTIRKDKMEFYENDWHNQVPDYMRHNESRGVYVEKLEKETTK